MKAVAGSSHVRVSPRTKATLQIIAKREGKPMQAVVDEAVERYDRDKFLDGVNADFAALRNNPKAWKEELAERALWDRALSDDLDEE